MAHSRRTPAMLVLADALPSFPATDYRPNQKSHKLRAKPRDLQFPSTNNQSRRNIDSQPQNKIVIPTEAKRSGGTCCSLHQQPISTEAPPNPFVIPRACDFLFGL